MVCVTLGGKAASGSLAAAFWVGAGEEKRGVLESGVRRLASPAPILARLIG